MKIVTVIEALESIVLPVVFEVAVDFFVERDGERLIIAEPTELGGPLVQVEYLHF